MTDLPEHIYLITVDNEWPVSVIADDNPPLTAGRVAREFARRKESGNVLHSSNIHVWRAGLNDIREVDLMPETTIAPSLRERT